MIKVKAANRSKRNQTEELAARVAERTAALRHELHERARIEAELAAERDKLRVFLAAAPVALFVFDAREEVVHANPAAERLFGDSPPGGGRRCGDILGCVHRRDVPAGCGRGATCATCGLYEAVRLALAGRAVHDHELESDLEAHGRREHRWHIIHAEPVALEGGPGAVLALHDVTELRRAQREREALQASLAQSDRLSSMGMLAAGVAHEINNPLSYVLFHLDSLVEDLPRVFDHVRRCQSDVIRHLGSETAERLLGEGLTALGPTQLDDLVDRLREAATGALRIKQITRSLGTFARVERTELTPVNVQTSVEQAITMARNEIRFRATLVKDFRPVPEVIASEGKLAQVVLNLLINAAHAIPEGHAEQNEIRVQTFTDGDQVCLEVSDTGSGIAPEHRARLFEPFFTTKGVGVGSGLGLSICQRIIGELGGTIRFDTEVGRGSTFRITLPPRPADWGPAPVRPPSPAPDVPRGRVLVVDDEAGIRQILVRILRGSHEVVAAASGEEARTLLDRDQAFDVILCDLMMPRVSGMELHAWMAERWPDLARRVVFVTGGAFTPGAGDYLAQVSNRRIDKPFDAPAIQRLVGELVQSHRAGR
jgi:signal transduction histidine kinase